MVTSFPWNSLEDDTEFHSPICFSRTTSSSWSLIVNSVKNSTPAFFVEVFSSPRFSTTTFSSIAVLHNGVMTQ